MNKRPIKRAVIDKPGADDGEYPVTQISYLDKTGNAEVIHPYGMGSNPPNDSLCILFLVNNEDENRAVIATRPDLRPKNLKPGEAYFGNLVTGSIVIAKENGDWDVTIKGDLNINITGDANITATGDANVIATNINLNGKVNLGSGGPAIARAGDPVFDIPGLVQIGIIKTGSGNHTAS